MKLFYHLISNDLDAQEYSFLLVNNKIKDCNRAQFKNFAVENKNNENYIFDILSYLLIRVKDDFKLEFNQAKGALNLLLVDPIIIRNFDDIFYNNKIQFKIYY